ncbi:MAG: hypothetical protein ACPLPR_01445 [Bacillota bacterium]
MPRSRLILATGVDELDRYYEEMAEGGGVEVCARVFYREAVLDAVKRTEADVLLLSAYLEGTKDMADVVFEARLAGLRVVFLAGDMPRGSQLIKDLIAMGVYDILFYGEDRAVRVEDIDACIERPRTFAEALKVCCAAAKPRPKRDFLELFHRLGGALAGKGGVRGAVEPATPAGPREAPAVSAAAKRKTEAAGNPFPLGQQVSPTGPQAGSAGPMRLRMPVVAVWSPAPCGKTLVSAFLSAALAARGVRVALVDLDTHKHALHTYLRLPEGEDTLGKVLSPALVVTDGPFGLQAEGVTVFSRDPALGRLEVEWQVLERFLNSPKVNADVFVCDMPCVAEDEWAAALLAAAWLRVLVVDPDPAHLAVVKREVKKVGCEFLVLNRARQEVTEVLGRRPDCLVPELESPWESVRREAVGALVDRLRAGLRRAAGT